MKGVVDRKSLAQKLWIPGDLDPRVGDRQAPRDLIGGAHGNGRLAHHESVGCQMRRQLFDGAEHLAHIRLLGSCRLRRAHADEVNIGTGGRLCEIRREAQTPIGDVAREYLAEPGLEERYCSLCQ